jgi:hypothetical protein
MLKEAMMGAAATSMIGGGAYMTGAFNGGEVYNMPIEQVFAELESMELPVEMQDGFAAQPGTDIRVSRQDDKSITWEFTVEGHELATFRADMEKVDQDHTRVIVHFSVQDPGLDEHEEHMADTLNAEPFFVEVGEIAFAEQIDATLEKRPFDTNKVGMEVMSYVAAHPEDIAHFQSTFQNLAMSGFNMAEQMTEGMDDDMVAKIEEMQALQSESMPDVDASVATLPLH